MDFYQEMERFNIYFNIKRKQDNHDNIITKKGG